MIFKKIWSYLTFQKQPEFESDNNYSATENLTDADDKSSAPGIIKKLNDTKYLSMMHTINRISIIMFLIGIIVIVIKLLK